MMSLGENESDCVVAVDMSEGRDNVGSNHVCCLSYNESSLNLHEPSQTEDQRTNKCGLTSEHLMCQVSSQDKLSSSCICAGQHLLLFS